MLDGRLVCWLFDYLLACSLAYLPIKFHTFRYNGGPGASSLFGLLQELGPLLLNVNSYDSNYNKSGVPTLQRNDYAWTKVRSLVGLLNRSFGWSLPSFSPPTASLGGWESNDRQSTSDNDNQSTDPTGCHGHCHRLAAADRVLILYRRGACGQRHVVWAMARHHGVHGESRRPPHALRRPIP